MDETVDRRGMRPAPFTGALLAGLLVALLPPGAAPLRRVFVEVGWDRAPGGFLGLAALSTLLMAGTLASRSVPSLAGRVGAAVACHLGTLVVTARTVTDPGTALVVGLVLGVLPALAGFLAFGVEGEGGLGWVIAIAAGILGIVGVSALFGAIDAWGRSTGNPAAALAGEAFGLGTLGIAGAVPAAFALRLQPRLARHDVALLNALAGGLAGFLCGLGAALVSGNS